MHLQCMTLAHLLGTEVCKVLMYFQSSLAKLTYHLQLHTKQMRLSCTLGMRTADAALSQA